MFFSTEHTNFMPSVTPKRFLKNYNTSLHIISLFYILKIGKSSHYKLTVEFSQFGVYQMCQIEIINLKFTGACFIIMMKVKF